MKLSPGSWFQEGLCFELSFLRVDETICLSMFFQRKRRRLSGVKLFTIQQLIERSIIAASSLVDANILKSQQEAYRSGLSKSWFFFHVKYIWKLLNPVSLDTGENLYSCQVPGSLVSMLYLSWCLNHRYLVLILVLVLQILTCSILASMWTESADDRSNLIFVENQRDKYIYEFVYCSKLM